MGYAQLVEVPGETMDDHRKFLAALGEDPPKGLILRVAGPTAEGIQIVTVWESKEDHDRFIAERLTPMAENLHRTLAPQVQCEIEVEELWRAASVAAM